MVDLTSLALSLLMLAVFLYLLFFVVRLAVKEGVQQALRTDLLDQRALGADPETGPSGG